MRLKTFVHISDIHISDANFDDSASSLYAVVPKLDGFLGHSYKSLTVLEPFFAELHQNEDAELILTGDLTRVGGAWEFDAAIAFLQDELVPPHGVYIGLRNPNWMKLTIPGNHDRYPGFPSLVGGPTATFSALFPGMPMVVDLLLPSSAGHLLRFLLIDTDADVWPWGSQRAKAKGSFVTQLRSLSALLGKQGDGEIRVLCLHHSRCHRGLTLEMDRPSRNALDDFIVDKGIAVLLSGHIHDPPQVALATAAGARGTATYLEARCGTTTQQNLFHLPHYWRNLPGIRRKGHWSNTLLVHRLFEEAGEIIWESELYLEDPYGFQLATPSQSDTMINSRVRVWPQRVK